MNTFLSLLATGNTIDVSNVLESATTSDGGAAADLINKTQDLGGAGYQLVYYVMIFVFLIGFVIAMIKLFLSNGQTRSESKSDIIWKVVAAVAGFAVVGLIGLLSGVGSTIFS